MITQDETPALNTERLEMLAAFLETLPPERFNMRTWTTDPLLDQPDCGTTACIGGWAERLFRRKLNGRCGSFIVSEILGLNEQQRWDLFFSETHLSITAKDAAGVIRNLIKTGKVDWRAVMARIDAEEAKVG